MHDRALAELTAALGERRMAVERAAGSALPPEQAVAEALMVLHAPDADASASLTPRELQVLRLVARQRTDREIAAALFLSRRTVNAHVAHVLAKLGVPTRQAAAVRGRELGLLADGDETARYT
jgi:DNA-binding CsgD family transcriptional regulator